MDLAPIITSELHGQARNRGKELSVKDAAGQIVVEARLGSAAGPDHAAFRTAHGEWRIVDRKRVKEWTGKGPRPMWRDVISPTDRVVIDVSNQDVATMNKADLTLADGETLTWAGPRLWSSLCGLGGDLWVARGLRPRRRGFRAELSGAMLAREDRALLTGIASILTQVSLTGGSGAADLGSSLGAGAG